MLPFTGKCRAIIPNILEIKFVLYSLILETRCHNWNRKKKKKKGFKYNWSGFSDYNDNVGVKFKNRYTLMLKSSCLILLSKKKKKKHCINSWEEIVQMKM